MWYRIPMKTLLFTLLVFATIACQSPPHTCHEEPPNVDETDASADAPVDAVIDNCSTEYPPTTELETCHPFSGWTADHSQDDQHWCRLFGWGWCYYYRLNEETPWMCAPEGALPLGSACTNPNDCGPWSSCHNCVCREVCASIDGQPMGESSCSSGTCDYSITEYSGFCV